MTRATLSIASVVWLGAVAGAQPMAGIWLDRPLSNWNVAPMALASPATASETVAAVARRCDAAGPRETAAERALADAGWLPFHFTDRQIVQGDVEIVAGMSGADGMCRPMNFNIFVFVEGRLAGTLSPSPMTSRSDGVAGAVRLAGDETVSAEYSRYADKDALCCPSGRVTVRFKLDRTGPVPLIVPLSLQSTRP